MPIPAPRSGESQDNFMSRCMRFMHEEGGRPQKQQVAICYSQWRKAKKGVMEDMDFKRFIPISKIDEEKRMVYGYASTPDLDSQGEIVSVDGLKKALPDYMAFPAIREMHQPKAAGVTKEAVIDQAKGLYIGAKIVADDAWKMVKEGVYRGFSIGGKIKEKVDNVITNLALSEISLVDVPANRNTVFTLLKREGENLIDMQKDIYSASRLTQLAEEISFRIDNYIARGKDTGDLEEALKRLKSVIAKEVKEKEDRSVAEQATVEGKVQKEGQKLPEWVEEQQEMINKYTISSLRKGVNEMEKAKKKVIEEELTEEKAVEEATEKETEETPQAPEETPEVPAKEAEKEEAAVETTEVPGESPQVGETVVDETKQTAEKTADIEKRLEKLETEVVTPKATKEEVAFTKVVARFDNQIAKVVSVLEGLKERLEKVEAMAAPVKVKPSYLVEKSEATADTGKGAEIKKRLEELTHVRDTDLVRYQREGMQDEALRLLDELRRIQ